jgi:KDO2-lipid IV(A) lauroyltransferase
MITSLNFQVMHHGVGVGKPLQDKAVASYITRRRGRYGTEIVDQTDVRQVMDFYYRHHVPVAYMMLSDQSPSNEHKSFWTMFMKQETPFLYGAEYFARKYNMPVIYYSVKKVSRGNYEVTFTPLCDNPESVPQYTIISRYIKMLENTINEKPEYWLWSHKRWKRTRPQDVELKQLTLNLPTTL